jgi:hypothetical protein
MAQHFHTELVDDIDPTHTADETVTFSLDGTHYEIDLATVNASKLRDTLAPWIGAARRAQHTNRRRITTITTTDRSETKKIRAWAHTAGITLGDRGRIPAEVVTAYRNRNNMSDHEKVEHTMNLKLKSMEAAAAARAAEAAAKEVTE